MPTPLPEPRPIEAWMRVLGQIEVTLAHCLRRAEEGAAPAPSAALPSAAGASLRLLDERLTRTQTRLEQAERNATAIDALLAAEAEALSQWQKERAAAERRLADWAAGAV
jgi:transposase